MTRHLCDYAQRCFDAFFFITVFRPATVPAFGDKKKSVEKTAAYGCVCGLLGDYNTKHSGSV